ncbi:XRE family transcriptional regulator [Enterobacter bugandensis]|uniref:XRE family transcriptional regulator n=1 Tax=Enterobacter TaxID=547 RepID=UPI000F846AD8|nr:XRE family transcriptional regulator [Enterobacter bugandensis]MCK7312122.1 XRE family transcriptional regulator [Enterobacter bugandensis]MCR6707453.1 XRE family transcriptional regulator [Enterobacter bugandensis]RTN87873.1 XRE family transcriptional regulator [Enterobacter bugandensis]
MEIKLHANATTTPRIRRYLQQSDKSDRELALELGISVTTVRRWRNRDQVSDNHTTPKVIHKALRQEQVALVNALRDISGAPLDELLQMVNDVLGIRVSRATLNRYLKPASAKLKGGPLQGIKALKAGMRPHTLMLHHLPLSLHMDDGGEQHLLWAREPVSGWCYARLYAGLSPQLLNTWTRALLDDCPADIQSIETFGFELTEAAKDVAVKTHPQKHNALQVAVPLGDVIPRVNDEPAGEVLIALCEFYNRGKTQKKLGESTPQAFLEALRRKD